VFTANARADASGACVSGSIAPLILMTYVPASSVVPVVMSKVVPSSLPTASLHATAIVGPCEPASSWKILFQSGAVGKFTVASSSSHPNTATSRSPGSTTAG